MLAVELQEPAGTSGEPGLFKCEAGVGTGCALLEEFSLVHKHQGASGSIKGEEEKIYLYALCTLLWDQDSVEGME